MPFKMIFALSLTALAFVPNLDAQWIPLIGEVRQQEFRVNADGSETKLRDRHGRFYRSSDGRNYRRWKPSMVPPLKGTCEMERPARSMTSIMRESGPSLWGASKDRFFTTRDGRRPQSQKGRK
jgi:hypothetical protein